jgi:hypothetical protein
VNLGDLGTWMLAGGGVSCATAKSVFNQYENASLRADGTTQPLGSWECRMTRFVAFKPDTNDGYEAWRCWQDSKWVTFATGNRPSRSPPALFLLRQHPPVSAPTGAAGPAQFPAAPTAALRKLGTGGRYPAIRVPARQRFHREQRQPRFSLCFRGGDLPGGTGGIPGRASTRSTSPRRPTQPHAKAEGTAEPSPLRPSNSHAPTRPRSCTRPSNCRWAAHSKR